MTVTSPEPEASKHASEQAIHAELLAARKRPGGLSPHTMAQCPVMCDLLGNGDPEVAHVELCHKIIEIIEANDDVMALEAACYSLGLITGADTHLARLEEFGAKHFIDQRQARRYSDRGLAQLARLIATHWTTQTVPEATVIIIGVVPSEVALSVQLRRQHHIDMRPAKLGLWPADHDRPTPMDVAWQHHEEPGTPWVEDSLTEPAIIHITGETTIRLVWRGETWPKYIVALSGNIDASLIQSQTLGAACAVTITPPDPPEHAAEASEQQLPR